MATYLSDTFTDADGTNLTAHTMDVGGGWSNLSGSGYVIQSNKASAGGSDDNSIAADAGQADVTLTCDCVTNFSGGNHSRADLIVRAVDANNYWLIQLAVDADTVTLLQKVTGGYNAFGSATVSIASGATTAVRVVCAGNTISVYLNGNVGTPDISYGSASFQNTATKFGFRTDLSGTIAAATWDNFLVTDTPAAGSPVPVIMNQYRQRRA